MFSCSSRPKRTNKKHKNLDVPADRRDHKKRKASRFQKIIEVHKKRKNLDVLAEHKETKKSSSRP